MYLIWPSGVVEIITNIGPDDRLVLEPHLFPIGVTFLELIYSNEDLTQTVRTIKPLDADVLKEVCPSLIHIYRKRETHIYLSNYLIPFSQILYLQ